MKKHTPEKSCKCAECVLHFQWLTLHIRALAEHKAMREREEFKNDPLLS